ncbi:MAG: tetratricopeptide repeat protein [Candidatus Daviesbacteria bacterium]
MDDDPTALAQQAITAALSANWEEALKLNQQIIDQNPNNIEALNRIARAYFELGNTTKAKQSFSLALEKDPYNQIASKFIKRIDAVRKKGSKKSKESHEKPIPTPLIDSGIFLEEPGVTKLVSLLKVAEPQRLSLLSPGMAVNLVNKNRSISVTDQNDDYLGVLPDDLSHHLLRLTHGGNKYQAFIKTVKTNGLSILIREIHRSTRFRNQSSFLDTLNTNLTYASSHIMMQQDMDEEIPTETDEEEEA